MGITGLLPLVKPATTDVKLEKLSGTVAAIDTNGWIHRACYSCGDKVYLQEETDLYIKYCVNLCELLRKHNITPILVFDGQSLPAKMETKAKRQARKEDVRKRIDQMLKEGDNKGARWMMRQAIDVTYEMCHRVIQKCREEKIDYIVAPYEADAQMAYLVNHGIADYAITEDSDLLVFGAKKVLYKLDRENEKGSLFDMAKLNKCFNNYCERRFQYMCILSGCDYLQNIPNVGLGRARKFFDALPAAMSIDYIREQLPKLPMVINMEGKVKVSNEYINSFIRAIRTFDHQLVFSPFTNNLTHFKSLRGGLAEHKQLKLFEYAGDFFDDKLDNEFAVHYAAGNVHPKTLTKIDAEFTLRSADKFTWFSDEITARVASKKGIATMTNPLFVSKSPVKPNAALNDASKPKSMNISRESKRKAPSPLKSEQKSSETSTKRARAVEQVSQQKTRGETPKGKLALLSDGGIEKSPFLKNAIVNTTVAQMSSTTIIKTEDETSTITRSGGARWTSSRNVFRKSVTSTSATTTSHYFSRKSEQMKIDSEVVVAKSPKKMANPVNDKISSPND